MQLVLDHLVGPVCWVKSCVTSSKTHRSRESEFHQLLIEKADASQSGAVRSFFYVNYVISLHVYRGLRMPKSQDFVTAMAQGISDWPYLEVLYTLSQVAHRHARPGRRPRRASGETLETPIRSKYASD